MSMKTLKFSKFQKSQVIVRIQIKKIQALEIIRRQKKKSQLLHLVMCKNQQGLKLDYQINQWKILEWPQHSKGFLLFYRRHLLITLAKNPERYFPKKSTVRLRLKKQKPLISLITGILNLLSHRIKISRMFTLSSVLNQLAI